MVSSRHGIVIPRKTMCQSVTYWFIFLFLNQTSCIISHKSVAFAIKHVQKFAFISIFSTRNSRRCRKKTIDLNGKHTNECKPLKICVNFNNRTYFFVLNVICFKFVIPLYINEFWFLVRFIQSYSVFFVCLFV